MSTRSILLTGFLLFSLEYILLCFTFESSQTIVQDNFPVDIISSIPDLQHPQSLVPLLNVLELSNVQIDSINPSTTKLQFSSQHNNTALQIQKIESPADKSVQQYKINYEYYIFLLSFSPDSSQKAVRIDASQHPPFLLKAWFSLTNNNEKIAEQLQEWIKRFSRL